MRGGVLITALICSTIVMLALIGAVTWLANQRVDAAVLLSLVNLILTAGGSLWVYGKVAHVGGKVETVERRVNGESARKLDIIEQLSAGESRSGRVPPGSSGEP